MSVRRAFIRRLMMASCLVVAAALIPGGTFGPSFGAAHAAAKKASQPAKMTGADLLKRTRLGLSLTAAETRKLTKAARGRAAPFVKAIAEADKALKALNAATSGKDKKALAKAMSAASKAAGKLNATYKKARIKSKGVAEGMRVYNAAWGETLKRLGGGKTRVTAETTRQNARRIAALKKRAETQKARRGITADELADIAYLIEALDRAATLNRAPEYQWMALVALDDVYGYYGGVYDYYAVYEPTYVAYYQEDYTYWSGVTEAYEATYETYYEEYSFETYTETVTIEESYEVEVDVTVVSETVVEEAEVQIETVEETVETVSAETEGWEQMEQVEAAEEAAPDPVVDDPADIADADADAAAEQPVSEQEAEAAFEEETSEGAFEEDAAGPDQYDVPEAPEQAEPEQYEAPEPEPQYEEPQPQYEEPEPQYEEPEPQYEAPQDAAGPDDDGGYD